MSSFMLISIIYNYDGKQIAKVFIQNASLRALQNNFLCTKWKHSYVWHVLPPIKLIESSGMLCGHPALDLGIVEVTFVLCSFGIGCMLGRQTDVRIVAR